MPADLRRKFGGKIKTFRSRVHAVMSSFPTAAPQTLSEASCAFVSSYVETSKRRAIEADRTNESKPAPRLLQTNRLEDDRALAALAAAKHAIATDRPLNRFITIDWERAGVIDVQTATRKFLKRATDFASARKSTIAYIWTIESTPVVGLHTHILMYLDQSLAAKFGHRQRAWLIAAGARYEKGLIKTRPIGGSIRAYLAKERAREAFLLNHNRVVAYILKCCSFEIARAIKSPFNPRSSPVNGPRLGISHNLGSAARKTWLAEPQLGELASLGRH